MNKIKVAVDTGDAPDPGMGKGNQNYRRNVRKLPGILSAASILLESLTHSNFSTK